MGLRIMHIGFFSDQSNLIGEQFVFAHSVRGTVHRYRVSMLRGSGGELDTLSEIRKQRGNRKWSHGIQF